MQVEATHGPFEELDVQALAVAVFKNEKPDNGFLKDLDELSGGYVKSAIESEEFEGKEGETAYFHLIGNEKLKARRLLLVGVGEPGEYETAHVSQMAGTAVRSLRSKNVKSIAIIPRAQTNPEAMASAVPESFIIALFDPDKYRTVEKEVKKIDSFIVFVEGADEASLKRGVERGRIIGGVVD